VTEYDELLARAAEFLTPPPVEAIVESPTAAIAAAGLLVEPAAPEAPVLDRAELEARAAEFLARPAEPEVPDPVAVITADAMAWAQARALEPPPVPVLDGDELTVAAAPFLAPPAVEVPDPGPVIAAEGLQRANAEPFLVDGVPRLPVHPPVVVDDGDETQVEETGEES
jgi:hypothetical protein